GGRSWVQLAHVTTMWYSDTTVSGGKTYQYRVRAYNNTGSSGWTTTGIVFTPNALRVDGPPSASFFVSSSTQDATRNGSALTRGSSGTILDYFLAPPSSSSRMDKAAVSLSPVAEKLAQKSSPALAAPSARSRPSTPATNALESSGQFSEWRAEQQ